MTNVKNFLNNIEKYLIYVFLTALLVLMFIQVVARYVFGAAWGWMEQITRLIFVYVTFAGISYACKKSEHLRVSFVAEFAPASTRRRSSSSSAIRSFSWWRPTSATASST